jgi:hypothetical protein
VKDSTNGFAALLKDWPAMLFPCLSRYAHARYLAIALGLGFLMASAAADELYPNELDGNYDQSQNFECIGSWGETIHNFVARGRYVYLGQGCTVRVLDISNAAKPVEVGWLRVAGKISTMDIKGTALYVATDNEGHGLKVIDISNPAKPRLSMTLPGNDRHLMARLMGDYLMVNEFSKYGEGYEIYDVRDPLNPKKLTGGGRKGFEVNPFCTDGIQFFEASQSDWVGKSVDIRDLTTSPTTVGKLPFTYHTRIAFSYDSKHLTAGNDATTITIPLRQDVQNLWYYLAVDFFSGLWRLHEEDVLENDPVFKLSSQASPGKELLEIKSEDGDSRSVVFADPALYAIADGKVNIYDLYQSAVPVLRGTFPAVSTFHNPIQVMGSQVLVNSKMGLCIFDISRRFEPRLIGVYRTFGGVQQVTVADGRAYAIDGEGGFCVFDISHSEHIKMLARHAWPGGQQQLEAVDGSLVYMRQNGKALRIYDLVDPTASALRGSCKVEGHLSLSGQRLYAAQGGVGLTIMDLANPAAIRKLGQIPISSLFLNLATSGSLVYLLYPQRLDVVDAADPDRPVLRGSLDADFTDAGDDMEYSLKKLGPALYVIGVIKGMDEGDASVKLVDASNPAEPKLCEHRFGRAAKRNKKDTPATSPLGLATKYPGWTLALSSSIHTSSRDSRGMTLYDVSNPLEPDLVGRYDRMKMGDRVAMGKEPICVADEWGGLVILRYIQKEK